MADGRGGMPDMAPRPVWGSQDLGRLGRLPPLEVERAQAAAAHAYNQQLALEALPPPIRPGPANYLEPIQSNSPHAGQRANSMLSFEALRHVEERLGSLETRAALAEQRASQAESRAAQADHRALTVERVASEMTRAYEIQNQRLVAVSGELARAAAELNDLRLRYEGAHSTNAQLAQQVMALGSEFRAQENKLAAAQAALADSARLGAELRGQVAMLGDEMSRASQDRIATAAAFERLNRMVAEGQNAVAMESRRNLEEQANAFRIELQRRQQMHLEAMTVLNREIEGYRAEAMAAGQSLHQNMDRLNTRLHAEEAALDRMRQEAAMVAAGEAAALSNVRVQVGELQAVLGGMGTQLQAEQAIRRQDLASLDNNMRAMEGALLQAQDQVARRTVALLEGKAGQFMRALMDVEGRSAERDEETKVAGEQQLGAFVKATARKEKHGLERILVMESALRDIATASGASLEQLQARLDQGLSQVAAAVEAAKAGTEDREAALRTQVNAALQKIRAYARDMEESLEQERIRLEEVVKMEIRARQQATDGLKDALDGGVKEMRDTVERLAGAQAKALRQAEEMEGQLRGAKAEMLQAQQEMGAKLTSDLTSKLEAAVAPLKVALATAAQDVTDLQYRVEGLDSVTEAIRDDLKREEGELRKEAEERRKAVADLRKWFDQNQVDAKLAEEALKVEIDAMGSGVEARCGAIEAEADKLKRRVAAQRKDHEALEQLVQVHSDVFVDVQRKLTSLDQRAKTSEVTLANLAEDTNDRIVALTDKVAKDGAELREGLEAKVAEEAAASTARARELEEKLARHQNVMEEVMAQVQDECMQAVNDVIAKVEEVQRMLEDEVATMDELVESKVKEMGALVEDKAQELQGQVAAARQESSMAVKAAAAAAAAALVALASETRKQHEALRGQYDELKGSTDAAAEELRGKVAAAEERLAQGQAALEDSLSGLGEDVKKGFEAMDERLATASQEVKEAVATVRADAAQARAELDAALEQQKVEVEASLALLRADAELAAQAQREVLAAAKADVETQLAEQRHEMAQAKAYTSASLAQAKADSAAALARHKSETDASIAALKPELEAAMAAQRAEVEEVVASMAAKRAEMEAAVEGAQRELGETLARAKAEVDALAGRQAEGLEALRGQMEATLAQQHEDIEGAMAAQQKQVAATQAEIVAHMAELKSELELAMETQKQDVEAARGELSTALEAHKAEFEAAVSIAKEDMEGQKEQIMGLLDAQHADSEEARARAAEASAQQARELEAQRAELELAIQKMQARVSEAAEEERAELGGTVERLRREVADALGEARVGVGEAIEGLREEVRAAIEAEKGAADGASAAVAALREEVTGRLLAQDNNLSAERKALERKIQDVASESEARGEALQQIMTEKLAAVGEEASAALRAARDELEREVAAAIAAEQDKTRALAAAAQEKVDQLAADVGPRLDQQAADLGSCLATLEGGLASLKDQSDALEQVAGIVADMRNQQDALLAEVPKFSAQHDELKRRLDGDKAALAEQLKKAEALAPRLDQAETKLVDQAETVDELATIVGGMRGHLHKMDTDFKGLPSKQDVDASLSKKELALTGQIKALEKRLQELEEAKGAAAKGPPGLDPSALDAKLAAERRETSAQLDELRKQLTKDSGGAIEKQEARIIARVKDICEALVGERVAELRNELPDKLRPQIAKAVKEEAVADIESKLHRALDDALKTIRDEVDLDLAPVKRDLSAVKAQLRM